jgi:hypothetical protein
VPDPAEKDTVTGVNILEQQEMVRAILCMYNLVTLLMIVALRGGVTLADIDAI